MCSTGSSIDWKWPREVINELDDRTAETSQEKCKEHEEWGKKKKKTRTSKNCGIISKDVTYA